MLTSQIKTKVVFAIYPNSNGFGFVTMENEKKLIGYGTVRIKPIICNRKALEQAKKLIDYYRPTIVIMPDSEAKSSRTGKRTRKLILKIMAYADSEKLLVELISRDRIRDVFDIHGAVTKYEIAQFLLAEFKELEPKRPRERKLWTSEDRNMAIFDALSLALTWYWKNE
jgi:hypothetical protein